MTNAQRYHFADFTLANYRRLVRLARERFRWTDYRTIGWDERFVLWRHDVDCSPWAARRMAEVERQEGVATTYFVSLRSSYYNLLDPDVVACFREILEMGHALGLHFDPACHEIADAAALAQHLLEEKTLLEKTLRPPVPVAAFSLHNPTPQSLQFSDWQYAGLVNTYAERFRREAAYCSDSNGYWRHRRLEDVLRDPAVESLQVLTHPMWWTDEVTSIHQRRQRVLEEQAARNRRQYHDAIVASGRDYADWDEPVPQAPGG